MSRIIQNALKKEPRLLLDTSKTALVLVLKELFVPTASCHNMSFVEEPKNSLSQAKTKAQRRATSARKPDERCNESQRIAKSAAAQRYAVGSSRFLLQLSFARFQATALRVCVLVQRAVKYATLLAAQSGLQMVDAARNQGKARKSSGAFSCSQQPASQQSARQLVVATIAAVQEPNALSGHWCSSRDWLRPGKPAGLQVAALGRWWRQCSVAVTAQYFRKQKTIVCMQAYVVKNIQLHVYIYTKYMIQMYMQFEKTSRKFSRSEISRTIVKKYIYLQVCIYILYYSTVFRQTSIASIIIVRLIADLEQ